MQLSGWLSCASPLLYPADSTRGRDDEGDNNRGNDDDDDHDNQHRDDGEDVHDDPNNVNMMRRLSTMQGNEARTMKETMRQARNERR